MDSIICIFTDSKAISDPLIKELRDFGLKPRWNHERYYWWINNNESNRNILHSVVAKHNSVGIHIYEDEYLNALKTIENKINQAIVEQENFRNLGENMFVGPLHTTSIKNLRNIFTTGLLYSRFDAEQANIIETDAADSEIIRRTPEYIKKYVRFYFFFHTPTNFTALQNDSYENPVILAFNSRIMAEPGAKFSERNAAIRHNRKIVDIFEAVDFPWNEILERQPLPDDETEARKKKAWRNGEFLLSHSTDLSHLYRLYFRSQDALDNAKKMLGESLDPYECIANPDVF